MKGEMISLTHSSAAMRETYHKYGHGTELEETMARLDEQKIPFVAMNEFGVVRIGKSCVLYKDKEVKVMTTEEYRDFTAKKEA